MPVSGTAVTPDYTTQVGTSFQAAGITPATANYQTGAPLGPNPLAAQAPPDYAALAAKDEQYAKNLAKSDPAQAKVYADRAAEYRSRAAGATATTTGASSAGATATTPPQRDPSSASISVGGPPPAQQQQAQPARDPSSAAISITQQRAPGPPPAAAAPAPSDHIDHYQNGVPVWSSGRVGW
jgi:hypothetical protein